MADGSRILKKKNDMTKAYTNCIQHKMQKQQEKNRHGNVEMNIMRIWRQRKSQNTVD